MPNEKHSCRCTSCGYVHQYTDPGVVVVVEPPPVPVPAVVIAPAVPQQSRCPLCGALFTDPAQYAAHRENNCNDAPPENPTVPVVEPTEPPPVEPPPVEPLAMGETEGPIAP